MNYPLYTLIDFPSFVNKTGSLTVFDHKNISFEIKRVFTIQNIKKLICEEDTRTTKHIKSLFVLLDNV